MSTETFDESDVVSWETDEYARRLAVRGHPVHCHDGVWWLAVRKRYCWTLDPLMVEPPGRRVRPARRPALAGYQIRVTDPDEANGYFNPMVLDDLPAYRLEKTVDAARRNRIRKGLKVFSVRPLRVPEALIRDGWKIETEFFERTNWHPPPTHDEWPEYCERAFRPPVIDHKLGAFAGERLVAYMTWFGIGRAAHVAHIASGHEGVKQCVNDALLYEWLRILRESGRFDRAVYSIRSFKASLDAFKEEHGFRMQSYPSRIVINPVVRVVLRAAKPQFVPRVMGLDAAGVRAWLESGRRVSASDQRGSTVPTAPGER